MGLIDFIKDAGEKIFGKDEAAAAPAQTPAVDVEKILAMKRARALEQLIGRLGLQVEGLRLELQGDTAIVYGKAPSQAEREKAVLAVGNVAGIARVDDRIEVEKKEPEATFHTVVRGDTLSKIAKHYYGNAGKYPRIFEANKPMLTDPDKIYPGQVLRIPPAEG